MVPELLDGVQPRSSLRQSNRLSQRQVVKGVSRVSVAEKDNVGHGCRHVGAEEHEDDGVLS